MSTIDAAKSVLALAVMVVFFIPMIYREHTAEISQAGSLLTLLILGVQILDMLFGEELANHDRRKG
jgi:hypothetical protein